MESNKRAPLFKLETLLELRIDPWDEVLERRREAVDAAATAASSSSSTEITPLKRPSTIVASAFKKVGDSSILAIVVETNSVLLRHWLSDGSGHKSKELMWFRSGQLRIRCMCFDPSGNWLLAVTADGRLYLIAALFILDFTASSDCSWATDDLVCLSEDLELEGRPSAICWWETLDNKKIAIVGTDCDELVFVDLTSRLIVLRLRQGGVGASDLIIVDLNVVSNDAQSQTTLLITQQLKLWGSGDAAASPRGRQMTYVGASSSPTALDRDRFPPHQKREQQQQQQKAPPSQQSCLVLEKRLEKKLSSLSLSPLGALDLDFAEDYAFQGLFSILDALDPSLPLPRPTSLPKIPDGSGKHAAPQFSKGHHFLSVFDPHHSTVEIWDPEMNQPAPSFLFDLPERVELIILTDHLLICCVDEGDHDEILFLSRHFTSKTIGAAYGNLTFSSPSSSQSLAKSPSSTKSRTGLDNNTKAGIAVSSSGGINSSGIGGGISSGSSSKVRFGRDWRFPRLLQRIRLPAGERLQSMEKITFPFYFLDEKDGEDAECHRDDVVEHGSKKAFGWSRACLQFSTPTVLDGCLVITQNCVFIVSPELAPERIAFEFMVHQLPAETFTTALGLHCTCAFEAAREYRLLRLATSSSSGDDPSMVGDGSPSSSSSYSPSSSCSLTVNGNDEEIWKSFLLLLEHGRYEEALSLNSKGAFDDAFAVGNVQIPPSWLVKPVPANQAEMQTLCRTRYFETLVALVRKYVFLSSSSPSSLWTTESISRFTSSTEVDFHLVISVLIRHDFLQLAFQVARKRNRLDSFLRLFTTVQGETEGTKSPNAFPWRLLLFDAALTPAESWTLIHFVKSQVDGLLDRFLRDADDDQLGALFRILSSSFALFVNSLDLVRSLVSRLDNDNLGTIIRLCRRPLPPGTPFAYSVTTLLQIAHICFYARALEPPSHGRNNKNNDDNDNGTPFSESDSDHIHPSSRQLNASSNSALALPLLTNALSAGYDRGIYIRDGYSSSSSNNSSSSGNNDGSTQIFLSKSFSGPSPTSMTLPYAVDSVSLGGNHVLALACGGSLMLSWGSNGFGQLGIGKGSEVRVVSEPTPVLITTDCGGDAGAAWWSSIDCGGHHSLALTRDGNLFSWGWGVYGQLAHDGINDLDRPRKVASNVRAISAGHAHSAIVSGSGRLYLVGSNHFGQLGIGDPETKKVASLQEISFKYDDDDNPSADNRVLAVSCGLFHTLALVETTFRDAATNKSKNSNNSGNNDDDAIGSEASIRRVFTWGAHPLVLRNRMRVGMKERKHMTPSVVKTPTMVGRVCHLSAGGRHDSMLTEDGYIIMWGSNAESQLGTGTNSDAREPALMIPLNDRKISRISAGGDFTMAADEDGAIFVWGKKSITQNFASTTSSSSSSSSATKVLSSSTSPSKMCKPFVRCGDRTVGRRMKEKVKELRLGSAKRVVESCPPAPSIGDYPPLPPDLLPFVSRLSSLDPNTDYDWGKVLSISLQLDSSRRRVGRKEGEQRMHGREEAQQEQPLQQQEQLLKQQQQVLQQRQQEQPLKQQQQEQPFKQQQQPPLDLVPISLPCLHPLLASLYWMRGMRTLCLVSLLDADSMTEEAATDLISRHFRACGDEEFFNGGEDEFPATLSWIFNVWSNKQFSTSGLESCLISVMRILPFLRRLVLNHLKTTTTTTTTTKKFQFSVGFLSRLFSAVMEEEEEKRRRLEGEEEKRRKETRERLWNAIENNLKREVGKRTKAISLSLAQVEALGNVSSRRNSLKEDVSDGLFLFTCGHHYKSAELRHFFHSSSSSSPAFISATAADDQNGVLLRLYESMTDFQPKSLACPACLAQCLKTVGAE